MSDKIKQEIGGIVGDILDDYNKGRMIDHMDVFEHPNKDVIVDIIRKLLRVVFPGFYQDKQFRFYNLQNNLSVIIEDVAYNLNQQIAIALRYMDEYAMKSKEEREQIAQDITLEFLRRIPMVREYIETDVEATLDGDPAAENEDEIITSYPGLFAIAINRLAHELFLLSVPVIPRIMTEHAHSLTGIDIHPGATLGKYFFIDHGTGIVIGETTTIGEHVKIYQGVTLGALSTKGGQKLRHTKRHPTIEDCVTIYSGASILGGDTVIGKNTVVGGNAFITSSISEGTRVSVKNQELIYNKKNHAIEKTDLKQDESCFCDS